MSHNKCSICGKEELYSDTECYKCIYMTNCEVCRLEIMRDEVEDHHNTCPSGWTCPFCRVFMHKHIAKHHKIYCEQSRLCHHCDTYVALKHYEDYKTIKCVKCKCKMYKFDYDRHPCIAFHCEYCNKSRFVRDGTYIHYNKCRKMKYKNCGSCDRSIPEYKYDDHIVLCGLKYN